MKEYLKNRFYRRVAGVQWHLGTDEQPLRVVIAVRQKGQLVIEKTFQSADPATLKTQLSGNLPIALVLTGRGLLEGKVNTTNRTDWPALLHERLPGADPAVFTGQLTTTTPARLSILRREVVAEIKTTFQQQGLSLVSVRFGLAALEPVLPLLTDQQNLACTPYSLRIENHRLIDAQKLTESSSTAEIAIGDQHLATSFLLPLGAALGQVIGEEPVAYQLPALLQQDYEQDQYTRIMGLGSLGLLFVILLVNFLVYNQTAQALARVEGELYYSQQLLSRMDSLEARLEQRRILLGDRQIGSSRLSLIADEIAGTIPAQIKLLRLQCFPPVSVRPGLNTNQQRYDSYILLRAETDDTRSINDWIDELEALSWTANVQLQPFQLTDKQEGVFELRLELDESEKT